MSNVTGKISDVHSLLEEALDKHRTDGVDYKISNTIAELVTAAGLKLTASHIQTNIYYELKRLIDEPDISEAGITYSSAFLDALCMYVHSVSFEKKYGRYTGSKIYNKKAHAVIDKNNKGNAETILASKIQQPAHRKEIIFALPKFQETIIPALHKSEYEKYSKVHFEDKIEWSECLEALINGKIDVAIHNFPIVLAYIIKNCKPDSIFFWPYLTFNGYAMFVKEKAIQDFCKKSNKKLKSFDDIKQNSFGPFLESLTISLDKQTDFEYVLQEFCLSHKANWEIVKSKIIDQNIDKGKVAFLRANGADLYITNHIQKEDILSRRNTNTHLIAHGQNLTRHKNYNGLVCSMEFFNENQSLIKALIIDWFRNIGNLQKEWKYIIDNNGNNKLNFLITNALQTYINDESKSNVDILTFVKSFSNNVFFSEPNEAFDSLYNDILTTSNGRKINWGIAQTQLQDNSLTINNDLINELISHMRTVKNQLNF